MLRESNNISLGFLRIISRTVYGISHKIEIEYFIVKYALIVYSYSVGLSRANFCSNHNV
jgi:hypothetical protein